MTARGKAIASPLSRLTVQLVKFRTGAEALIEPHSSRHLGVAGAQLHDAATMARPAHRKDAERIHDIKGK